MTCTTPNWPSAWRLGLIALCALILCSCRGPATQPSGPAPQCPQTYPTLPEQAYTGAPVEGMVEGMAAAPLGPPGMEQGVPLPFEPAGPWSPPGIRQPWPEGEYLRDGGDEGLRAAVGQEWDVRGLEPGDTIAHYDTLAGQRVVEPSNPTYIYSPRFGAVRQVVSLVANHQSKGTAGVDLPTKLVGPTTLQIVASSKQNIQAEGQIGAKSMVLLESDQGGGVLSTALGPRGFHDAFLPYESVRLIRLGVIDASEMAWLARGQTAAIAWTHDQAVQVVLDHQAAMVVASDQNIPSVYTVERPPANPKLRVVKVASTGFAEPGDEVDFTIRFDNVGNQPIGNVTIVDNLTTRLEYTQDSAQCSVDATFSTQPNEGDSVALRCELANPLEPGQGGVLRFRCRVR